MNVSSPDFLFVRLYSESDWPIAHLIKLISESGMLHKKKSDERLFTGLSVTCTLLDVQGSIAHSSKYFL